MHRTHTKKCRASDALKQCHNRRFREIEKMVPSSRYNEIPATLCVVTEITTRIHVARRSSSSYVTTRQLLLVVCERSTSSAPTPTPYSTVSCTAQRLFYSSFATTTTPLTFLTQIPFSFLAPSAASGPCVAYVLPISRQPHLVCSHSLQLSTSYRALTSPPHCV